MLVAAALALAGCGSTTPRADGGGTSPTTTLSSSVTHEAGQMIPTASPAPLPTGPAPTESPNGGAEVPLPSSPSPTSAPPVDTALTVPMVTTSTPPQTTDAAPPPTSSAVVAIPPVVVVAIDDSEPVDHDDEDDALRNGIGQLLTLDSAANLACAAAERTLEALSEGESTDDSVVLLKSWAQESATGSVVDAAAVLPERPSLDDLLGLLEACIDGGYEL